MRRTNSTLRPGQYNIPGVGLFVWRLKAYSITRTFAELLAENRFTFSILGNDIPLYTFPQPEDDRTHIAGELNVPAPIRRWAFEEIVNYGDLEKRQASADYYGEGKSVALWTYGWPEEFF